MTQLLRQPRRKSGKLTDLSTIVQDVYHLLEGKRLGDPEILDKFGPRLGDVLKTRLSSKQEERQPTLRMSNIGTPCLRKLWYDIHGFKGEELSGKTLLKFAYGDLVEALVLVLAEAAGHKVERFQEEVSVDGILGHIDAVIDGTLVDVKSCSGYTFEKFKSGSLFEPGGDAFGYVAQLCGYAHALNLPAAWLAVDKTNGDLCTLELPKEKISEYDIQRRVAEVRSAVSQSDAPERHYTDLPDGESGNRKLSIECSFCSHRSTCWSDSNDGRGLQVYLYSGKPRSLTVVKREPRVFKLKGSTTN